MVLVWLGTLIDMTSGMHKELIVHLQKVSNHNTCGMLLNRKIWSERVEPGNTSPPIAIPVQLKNVNQIEYFKTLLD